MFTGIDLYSDTSTRPSLAMKQAMMDALLGDEQQGEDPTTRKLEERMSALLGTTAAMFFPSATMANQIAIYLHARAGEEVLGADLSHVFTSEAGGLAFHTRAQTRMIPTIDGTFSGSDMQSFISPGQKIHPPKTAVVVVENTMNGGGGTVWPLEKLDDVVSTAHEHSLKLHLDGARLFNAQVAAKVDLARLSRGFHTVTVCFSKGLGCATGAILGFSKEDWFTVRKLKQVFGGAMRQSGVLSAACLYALDHYLPALEHDHIHAQRLATLLCEVPGLTVWNKTPASNMVYFGIDEKRMSPENFLASVTKRGVRFSYMGPNRFRAVTHRDVGLADIETAFSIVSEVLR